MPPEESDRLSRAANSRSKSLNSEPLLIPYTHLIHHGLRIGCVFYSMMPWP